MKSDGSNGVLVLDMESAGDLLSHAEAYEAIKVAFRELGENPGAILPRRRIYSELLGPDVLHFHNNMAGVVREYDTLAVRIDSAIVRIENNRQEFHGDFSGLVMLYSVSDARPYAIVHDHILSAIRVAATSALAARYMARPEPRFVALYGSGNQAVAHLEAHLLQFGSIEHVRLFTPTYERCRAAAERLSETVGVRVTATRSSDEALKGADMVIAATNGSAPVFDGAGLEAGQHVTTIASSDGRVRRREIDQETVDRSDVIMVNSIAQIEADQQLHFIDAVKSGQLHAESFHELPAVTRADASIRTSDEQITLYDNNVGMGIQFAATGAVLVQKALKQKRGRYIDKDLLFTRRTSDTDRSAP